MLIKAKIKCFGKTAFLHACIHQVRATHRQLRRMDTTVPAALLEDARLVPDRTSLLDRMPKGGTVAESDVAQGVFSERVHDSCKPEKYYLIDAWVASQP